MVLLLNLWSEALKVMPTLLMQIPNVDSKLDSHLLQWCLDLWLKGEFMALFNEGRVIQDHKCSRHPNSCFDDQYHSGRLAHLLMGRKC